MHYRAHRFALFATLCCCSLLLSVGMAAPASEGRSTPRAAGASNAGTWLQVFTWSGGGPGNDIRNSAAFTLKGGQQLFSASAAAVPGEYTYPMSGWTVESADGGYQFEMINPPGMGQSESHLYLPAGSYYVGSNTLDCTWTVVISELTPAPTITLFTPDSGPVGTSVTLTGTGLTGATAVRFNGAAATTFAAVSATQLTATVPAGATTGPITVTTPGGSAGSAGNFTVIPAPSLTKLSPTSGKRSATVTITGMGFGAARGTSAVKFGNTTCTKYVTWNATKIQCKVPTNTKYGATKVTVTTLAGRSNARSFTVKR